MGEGGGEGGGGCVAEMTAGASESKPKGVRRTCHRCDDANGARNGSAGAENGSSGAKGAGWTLINEQNDRQN